MVTIHVDMAESYLMIRVGLLTSAGASKTIFWQARHLASKSAEAIWIGLRNAFLQKPHKHLCDWYVITEKEWLQK
eukprot:4076322-Karenia_brevis.AAC.1